MAIATLDEALLAAALEKVFSKEAAKAKISLEEGKYEVSASITGRVKRAGGRWRKDVSCACEAKVTVSPPREYSVSPSAKEIVAALLLLTEANPATWARRLSLFDFGGLTKGQFAHAQIVLDALKTTRAGHGVRVEASGAVTAAEA